MMKVNKELQERSEGKKYFKINDTYETTALSNAKKFLFFITDWERAIEKERRKKSFHNIQHNN